MQSDAHERARFLIDEAQVGGISQEDAGWLRAHGSACAECAWFEETTARIVRGLGAFSFPRQAGWQPAGGHRPAPLRWILAVAAVVVLAAVPVFQIVRAARQERAD